LSREDAWGYLDKQTALSSKSSRKRTKVPLGAWKNDPGVADTELLVFSISSKVA
jgi:hypothetical protein